MLPCLQFCDFESWHYLHDHGDSAGLLGLATVVADAHGALRVGGVPNVPTCSVVRHVQVVAELGLAAALSHGITQANTH